MDDKCFYCHDTGYIHTDDDIPDQMCPNCEIGQAVIKGYNMARDLGVQACDTLEAAKNERIKELEGKIERAKDITNSQSFWCELADKECVGMKSIVHLVEQALEG